MTARGDRLLPETRWASLLVIVVVGIAFVILWGFPDRTADLWAWTIEPDLTPIFLGAVYGAGGYFLARVYISGRWHPASAGMLGIAVFSALMLVTTLIHWDRFNHGDAPVPAAVAFYLWVGLYIAFTPLVTFLWLRNRRADPRRPEPGDPIVPTEARLFARIVGSGALLAAAIFLLWPDGAIDAWPWDLTPLTARVIGCCAAQLGVGALVLSYDERWSSWRVLAETFAVATAFLLLGAVRAWNDFHQNNPLTWLYLATLAGAMLGLGLLYRSMETGRRE